MLVVIAFYRICLEAPWSADLLNVLVVFLTGGFFILILFAGQLFLIYQIEQGGFFGRRPRPRN